MRDWRAAAPAVTFIACWFGAEVELSQADLATERYAPALEFSDCETVAAPAEMLVGAGLGFEVVRVGGLLQRTHSPDADPAVACLRALLKPFFPTWAGGGATRQVRGYIRSSAIGRGAMPDGAPTARVLEEILRSAGFTSGGRQAHLYAPWASVVGGGADAMALRNELAEFVARGTRSARVEAMLDRLRRAM